MEYQTILEYIVYYPTFTTKNLTADNAEYYCNHARIM